MRLLVLTPVIFLTVVALANAATPTFANGPLVARKMEAHYNSADYKRRLAPITLKGRVLCAADWRVECSARMRAQRETDNQWVIVQTTWTLTKMSATRARLRWQVEGPQVFQSSSMIVVPRYFGLTRF